MSAELIAEMKKREEKIEECQKELHFLQLRKAQLKVEIIQLEIEIEGLADRIDEKDQ